MDFDYVSLHLIVLFSLIVDVNLTILILDIRKTLFYIYNA